jgi:hypothetical protein
MHRKEPVQVGPHKTRRRRPARRRQRRRRRRRPARRRQVCRRPANPVRRAQGGGQRRPYVVLGDGVAEAARPAQLCLDAGCCSKKSLSKASSLA